MVTPKEYLKLTEADVVRAIQIVALRKAEVSGLLVVSRCEKTDTEASDEVLTISQACDVLKVSRTTLRRLSVAGKIEMIDHDNVNYKRYYRSEVLRYLERK